MKGLIKSVRLTLMISGLFSVAILIAYIVGQGWNEASVWGAFGDFVGGVLNPVFAFANVIVLVVISYQLAEIEEARSEKDRISQERQFRFGMQYAAIQEVTNFLYQIEKAVSNRDVDLIEELRIKIFQAVAGYKILFPSLETFDLISLISNFRRLAQAAGVLETLDMMEQDLNYDDSNIDYSKPMDEFRKCIPPVYDILNSLQRAMTRDLISQNKPGAQVP